MLRLGERLVDANVISQEQLEIALEEQTRDDRPLGELVIKLGFTTARRVAEVVAQMAGTRYHPLADEPPNTELLDLVPASFSRQQRLVPIKLEGERLTVALANPFDILAIDALRELCGKEVDVVVSTEGEIAEALGRVDPGIPRDTDETDQAAAREERETLADGILREALRQNATAIHLEPEAQLVRVRYRVDGVLLASTPLAAGLGAGIIEMLKARAGLDRANTQRPRSGRLLYEFSGEDVRLSLATMPTTYGESLTLTHDTASTGPRTFEDLGMSERDLGHFRSLMETDEGLILVTGPPGSGRTTTAYAALASLDASASRIVTLEDHVTRDLPQISQTAVGAMPRYSFAAALRALLRQDPDIVAIDEMNDPETATIALRAALDRSLVIGTYSAPSALDALAMMRRRGVPADLLAGALKGVLAQRLVHLICEDCIDNTVLEDGTARRLGLRAGSEKGFQAGSGCARCRGTGYRGQTALFEVLRVTESISDALLADRSDAEIAELAGQEGFRLLRKDGLIKARAGLTTADEVLRTTADAPLVVRQAAVR